MSFELQKYILSYSSPVLALKFLFYNFSAANLKFQINQLNEKLNYEYKCNTCNRKHKNIRIETNQMIKRGKFLYTMHSINYNIL